FRTGPGRLMFSTVRSDTWGATGKAGRPAYGSPAGIPCTCGDSREPCFPSSGRPIDALEGHHALGLGVRLVIVLDQSADEIVERPQGHRDLRSFRLVQGVLGKAAGTDVQAAISGVSAA